VLQEVGGVGDGKALGSLKKEKLFINRLWNENFLVLSKCRFRFSGISESTWFLAGLHPLLVHLLGINRVSFSDS